MQYSSDILKRIAQDKMQDLQKEAAVQRQLPSLRYVLAARLVNFARWLEPELSESAPAPKPLSH